MNHNKNYNKYQNQQPKQQGNFYKKNKQAPQTFGSLTDSNQKQKKDPSRPSIEDIKKQSYGQSLGFEAVNPFASNHPYSSFF